MAAWPPVRIAAVVVLGGEVFATIEQDRPHGPHHVRGKRERAVHLFPAGNGDDDWDCIIVPDLLHKLAQQGLRQFEGLGTGVLELLHPRPTRVTAPSLATAKRPETALLPISLSQ